jgi:hypothetical protein
MGGGDLLVADTQGGDGKSELMVENSGRVVSMGGLAVDNDLATPGEQFSVDSDGTVTIADGSQGAGRVLTSDASGTATWADPAGVAAVPSGAVLFFHLQSCPTGWTRFTLGEGRYLVGLHPGGALANAVGTPLTDQEHRVVGQHSHTASIDPDPHDHDYLDTPGGINAAAPNGGGTVSVVNQSYAPATTETTSLTVTVDSEGTVAGTNAPYLQLLVCKKD